MGRRPTIRLEHEYIHTNGVVLHTVQAGPVDGPPVILLHGFPEFWYGWNKQIPFLANAGYRVWAPDQRGYNLSEKPPGVAAYDREQTAADIVGLIDAGGWSRAAIVGHDWGALAAWRVAIDYPERVKKLIILNGPHPSAMRRLLQESWVQRLRSTYAAFFQIPWLPEQLLGAAGGWLLARVMRQSSRPGTFSADELARYRQSWDRPDALKAMLNWYRAARIRSLSNSRQSQRVVPSTLILWGRQDHFLSEQLGPASKRYCDDGRLIFVANATHWLQHEEPALVNSMVADFLTD